MRLRFPMLAAAVAAVAPSLSFAAVGDILFSDDFEGGVSAGNYTLVSDPDDIATGTRAPGGVRDLFDAAYAYTDLGALGDVRSGTGGQLITDNALTAFVNGLSVGSVPIKISYDLYSEPRSNGSTEYSFVGVGDGSLPFQNYLRGSIQGAEQTQGVFAGGSTDSDTTGAGDYVLFEGDGTVSKPVALFDGDAAGNAQTGISFADILPAVDAGPSGLVPSARTLKYRWVAVDLVVKGSDVSYFLDGNLVASVTASAPLTGLVGFGVGDSFPSVNQSALQIAASADTFVLIDNIVITEIPEPVSLMLVGSAVLLGFGRVRRD